MAKKVVLSLILICTLSASEGAGMSFNADQFRDLIKRVLKDCEPVFGQGFASDDAVELLMLTSAQESHLGTYLSQVEGGAKGVFQIELATEYDIWHNYLDYFPEKAAKVEQYTTNKLDDDLDIEANLPYQIIMARLKYWRSPKPMPKKEDVDAMAWYWKTIYNSWKGKGTPDKAVKNYKRFCL